MWTCASASTLECNFRMEGRTSVASPVLVDDGDRQQQQQQQDEEERCDPLLS